PPVDPTLTTPPPADPTLTTPPLLNGAPVIAPVANQVYGEGVPIAPITISVTDPNNLPCQVVVMNLPSGASYDPLTSKITGTITYDAVPVGGSCNYQVLVEANNGFVT